jgi:hypothetical protein
MAKKALKKAKKRIKARVTVQKRAKAKKKGAKKKPLKRRALKKPVRKITAKNKVKKTVRKKKAAKKSKPAPKKEPTKKAVLVEPGPPSGSIPPVEEPSRQEDAVAVVTHYYSHLGVAVVQLNKGSLKVGDAIHVKGHTTDFTQKVISLEYEHQHVDRAEAGQNVGLKVIDHAREHDIVYLVK